MCGYIYLTTNLVNGKKYVGMHKKSYFDTTYKGSGKVLRQAFEKYGWDNFKSEVIEWCETYEDLCDREVYWINKLNAVNSREYYNLGRGGTGWQVSLSGESHPMYGLRGVDSPLYGHKVSEETRDKIREKAQSRIWVFNEEGVETTVDETKLDEYLSAGWFRGRVKSSLKGLDLAREGNKFSDNKGRIFINNGSVNKLVHKEDLCNYEGWSLGSLSKSTKGRKWYTNGLKDILLSQNDEIPSGYYHGRSSAIRTGESNPFYGKHHTKETKKKIRETKLQNLKQKGRCD